MNRDVRLPVRRGFTIIELLIVIVIIGILATLTMQVVNGMLGNANKAATSATLNKIQGLLNDRVENFTRLDLKKFQSKAISKGARRERPAEVEILTRKLVFKEEFPQNWQEFADRWPGKWNEIAIRANSVLVGRGLSARYSTVTPGATVTDPPPVPEDNLEAAAESAEVLYYMLTEAPITGFASVEADEFSSTELADTDNDGLTELVDAWEQPIRFYRWPTGLLRPDGDSTIAIIPQNLAYAQALIPTIHNADFASKDPDDPFAVMNNIEGFEESYHTLNTYHLPLVVSAGPDEDGSDDLLGLYEPTDKTNFGHLGRVKNPEAIYDNLTNHNNRAAGN